MTKRFAAARRGPACERAIAERDQRSRSAANDHPFFLPFDLANRGVVDAIDILVARRLHARCVPCPLRDRTNMGSVILQGAFAITYLGQVERALASRGSPSRIARSTIGSTCSLLTCAYRLRNSIGGSSLACVPDDTGSISAELRRIA
jgi:hypothetical protein